MPLIRGIHNGRAAIVTVAIVDAAKYKEHKQSAQPVLKGAVPFKALIDTGATRTMIAGRVVARLGLQQVNKIEFSGLGGTTWRPGYLFHVAFYQTPPRDQSEVSRIRVLNRGINGGELLDEHTFDVLLGMDVLTTGNLHINKDGTFRFLFGE
jgi:hypothetical protein